jgi:hypothetical protein
MWADRWADADDEPMDEPKRAKLKPISENGRQLNIPLKISQKML